MYVWVILDYDVLQGLIDVVTLPLWACWFPDRAFRLSRKSLREILQVAYSIALFWVTSWHHYSGFSLRLLCAETVKELHDKMLDSVNVKRSMPPNAWLWSLIENCQNQDDIHLLFDVLQNLRRFVSTLMPCSVPV